MESPLSRLKNSEKLTDPSLYFRQTGHTSNDQIRILPGRGFHPTHWKKVPWHRSVNATCNVQSKVQCASAMCNVQRAMCKAKCSVQVQCAMYNVQVQCSNCNVQLCKVQCAMVKLHCAKCNAKCAMCSVMECAVGNLECAVCNNWACVLRTFSQLENMEVF